MDFLYWKQKSEKERKAQKSMFSEETPQISDDLKIIPPKQEVIDEPDAELDRLAEEALKELGEEKIPELDDFVAEVAGDTENQTSESDTDAAYCYGVELTDAVFDSFFFELVTLYFFKEGDGFSDECVVFDVHDQNSVS